MKTESNETQQGVVAVTSNTLSPGLGDDVPGESAGATEAILRSQEVAPVEVAETAPAPAKVKVKRSKKARKVAKSLPQETLEVEPVDTRLEELSIQLSEQAELLAANATATDALKSQLRDTAIHRLGILPHYRNDVPDFDVTTDDGRSLLEAWAAARPEIRATAPVAGLPSINADDVLSKVKSPHLVDAEWFRRALAEA